MSVAGGLPDPEAQTVGTPGRARPAAGPPREPTRRLARRHPDIEVARLLVRRGFVDKAPTVDCLKVQKKRAKAGKRRIPFLQLLVKRRVLDAHQLPEVQDEIRRNTYLCDFCDARAIILAGSQSRAGACPRCGNAIAIEVASDDDGVPVREFTRPRPSSERGASGSGGVPDSGTLTWRPLGSRSLGGLPLGEVAFGKYLVREELGRGAMGIVYRATHMELAKDFALKVLIPSDEGWEHQVARFRREAAAVQKLRHEGIVSVHDFGTDGERYYLTMELVEGGASLHRRLKDWTRPAPLRERVQVLMEVARAVDHAHEHGVVHRDLKPANVLLTGDGRAKVADFGLAKDEAAEAGELTRTHDRLGTPLFMAPEQIRKGASTVDGRADVWALGVMLFVCATGRYPFRSRTVMDLYLRIMRELPDWAGDRYSAPDRAGFRPGAEPPPGASLASTGAGSNRESATEVGGRDSEGNLPRVLPEPVPVGAKPGSRGKVPFAPPPGGGDGVGVSGELRAIVECALAKDPDDRYPTAGAFADDLERLLEGRRVHGGGPSLFKRLRQSLWRRRVLRPLALALGVVALVSAAAGVIAVRRAGQREARLASAQAAEAAWAGLLRGATGAAHEQAEADLTALDERTPGVASVLVRRAQVRARLGRLEAALADAERAQALARPARERPADPRKLAEAALVRADLLLRRGDADGAAGEVRALAAEPDGAVPPALVAQAASLLARAAAWRDPGPDRATCAAAVDRLGEHAPAALHAAVGQLALAAGDVAGAEARLEAAQRSGSGDREVRLLAGAVLLAKGRFAGRVFDQLPAPGVELAWLASRAQAHIEANRPAEALAAASQAARLAPWDPEPALRCGALRFEALRAEEALPWLRRAVRLNPHERKARDLYLAILLAGVAGERPLAEAAEFLRREAAVRDRSAEPWFQLSAVLLRLGDLPAARAAIEQGESRRGGAGRAGLFWAAWSRAAEASGQGLGRDPHEDEAAAARAPLEDLYRLQDFLTVTRVYLDAGRLDAARAASEVATALASRLDARSWTVALSASKAHVLAARVAAAADDLPGALTHLQAAVNHTAAPELTPAFLPTLPELAPLRRLPGLAALLEELRERAGG